MELPRDIGILIEKLKGTVKIIERSKFEQFLTEANSLIPDSNEYSKEAF